MNTPSVKDAVLAYLALVAIGCICGVVTWYTP